MPKAATSVLIWIPEHASYELHKQGSSSRLKVAGGEPAWMEWLEGHGGFAFDGLNGRINVLKEARKGGAGYWYAYRRQGRRTAKRYLGRSAELTPERLEQAAAALANMPQPTPPPDDRLVPQ